MEPIRVLFVCLGNICRSPMAEAVFRHLVVEAGLADRIQADSAGTGDWHLGSAPHPSTQEQLRLNGVVVGDQQARQVRRDDAELFDYVVAMDSANLGDLRRSFGMDQHAQLSLLLDHADADLVDVPDPYYAGGYDRVYELVDDGCRGLLVLICRREGIDVPAA